MPQTAIRVVAKRNECEMGARIMEAPKASWVRAQAVGMSGWYFRMMELGDLCGRGGSERPPLAVDDFSSSVGPLTNQGRMMEPQKAIRENRTSAKDPLRAMSPSTSVELFSSLARSGDWR